VRLRQIVLNLLSNANKFTTSGEISLGADVQPPHLHLWVSDTGAGIAHEAQARIFEPFGSVGDLRSRPEGIGLGLSITRLLVALHNGSIALESGAGTGSTFHIYLPLPGLEGQSIALPSSSTTDVLLLISHHPEPSQAILQLCQRRGLSWERITCVDDVSQSASPAVLAWDMGNAHPADWELISQLRRSPAICRLPFVIYNQAPGASGLTNVLVKPVAQSTLLDLLNSLQPSDAGERIALVVDDDAQARELYARLLSEALPGVRVESAADGQFALDALETITPCLVLLDLMMPRVDGFAVLERMRTNTRLQAVPVLVMSGKLLTEEDARRLDYARVVFQGKEILRKHEALAALHSAMTDEGRLPQATSAVVKQALAYMHQHYASPRMSRQKIAQAVSVSERYLSEIFRQEMGITPWDALNRLRVLRACELLMTTDNTVTEIAAQVGFDDPSYFGRVFRQQMGISPKKYRER
jgi:AraC-like DNA-binding protein